MAKARQLPSVKYLKECFDYDGTNGHLIWKTRPRSHFKTDKAWATINGRCSGLIAGATDRAGYLVVGINGQLYRAHRIVWAIYRGRITADDIDHINGVKFDNRIRNLRLVTRGDNLKNLSLRSSSSSGHTGVSWNKRKHMWRAYIGSGRTQIHIGYFNKFDAAISARKEAERKYGFHPNHGRRKHQAAAPG